jgi:hypothetical protein
MANGYPQSEIELELEGRDCGWESSGDPECEKKKRDAKRVALELVQGNNEILVVAHALTAAWVIALRLMLFAVNALPGGRLVGKPAGLIVGQLNRFDSRIVARRAANDELYKLVANL